MVARLALSLALVLVAAPPALAATPDIHAHRGGTVVNGKARFAEESLAAYRNAARFGFVLEVDAKLSEDGVPVAIHDATLDRTTGCTGEVRTFTVAELAGCRTDVLGSPGSPLPTRPREPAGADHHDPGAARVRAAGRGRGEPRDQERPGGPRLRLHAGVREQGHGRGARERHSAPPAHHPELRRAESRRGPAAASRGQDQPALRAGDQRGVPPGGGRQRLRLHLAPMARDGGLRQSRARHGSGRGAVHARRGGRRARRPQRPRGRADHRRPVDGGPHARAASRRDSSAPAPSSTGVASSRRATCSRPGACPRGRDVAARSRCA